MFSVQEAQIEEFRNSGIEELKNAILEKFKKNNFDPLICCFGIGVF